MNAPKPMHRGAGNAAENVETLRRIYDEWGRGRFQAGFELLDPWVVLGLGSEFPDAGAYLGPEGIRRYMLEFLKDWNDAAIEGEEFVEAGDSVVVAVHQRAAGKGSGAPVDMRYFQVWTFRGGRVIRIESIKHRRDALQAVGLAE